MAVMRKHKGQFQKGQIPWNKGKTGLQLAWNKGIPLSEETKKKLKKSLKGRNVWNKGKKGLQIAWNKGKKCPQLVGNTNGFQKGCPPCNKGKKMPQYSGKKHWNWKGGITEKNRKIRNSVEYKNWRRKVFQRDRFTCVICGYRSKGKDIRADHIKPFNLYPELRFVIDNGRTLCLKCDLKYGWQNFRENNPRVKLKNE